MNNPTFLQTYGSEYERMEKRIPELEAEVKRLQEELEGERLWIKEGKKLHDVQKDEIKRLQSQRSSDLKIIDELLCHIKGSKAWTDIGWSGRIVDGGPATRDAMVRLEQAWTQGEMEICTMSLVNYFDARRDVQVSIEAAEEKDCGI